MKRLAKAILVSTLACFCFPAAAADECIPEFFRSAQSINVRNIVAGRTRVRVENFDIRVRNAGDLDAPCVTALRFARLGNSPAGDRRAFTLRTRQRVVQILPNEGVPGTRASDIPVLRLSSESNGLAVPFNFLIPSDWGVKDGTIVDQLLVSLLDANREVVDTMLLTVRLEFPTAVEMRIVGATGRGKLAQINLGTLKSDATTRSDPFGIRVWSTSPYSVSFRSENAGALVTPDLRGRIEYQLFMNGKAVNLSGQSAGGMPRGTGALGDFHRLRVLVPPFQSRAGEYSDRVEVTVSTT
ncbi:MAG: hypothetical protein AAFZ11_11180 [Pseudomonadota bacterium]